MKWKKSVSGSAHSVSNGAPNDLELLPNELRSMIGRDDERFKDLCADFGILLANEVKPVPARILPFGTEQSAMVRSLDRSSGVPKFQLGGLGESALSSSESRDVLAASIPSTVVEGKIRTGIVFLDGQPPVRWGQQFDEGRLASLFGVVSHLGSFSATTSNDTYRVLRLPGIGVSVVSEGTASASWIEGWFTALLCATELTLRREAASSGALVAVEPGQGPEPPSTHAEASVQALTPPLKTPASEPMASAPAESVAASVGARAPSQPLGASVEEARAELLAVAQHEAHELRREADVLRRQTSELQRDAERIRDEIIAAAQLEAERVLHDAERIRDEIIEAATLQATQLQRDAERVLRDAERIRDEIIEAVTLKATQLQRDAERIRDEIIRAAKRDAKKLRRDAKRSREELPEQRRTPQPPAAPLFSEDRLYAERSIAEMERTAADLLHDAERSSRSMLEEARREVKQMLRDTTRHQDAMIAEARRSAEMLSRSQPFDR
jgi:cell division septum initiation protein DivIVA